MPIGKSEGGLPPEERILLDPLVDVEQLELFLSKIPSSQRATVLAACRAERPSGAYQVIGATDPELNAIWQRVWKR